MSTADERTVLVVDDEPGVLSVAQAILKSAGYAVLTASSGEQALEVVRGQAAKIDVLLSDVRMPRMTGPELVEKAGRIAPAMKCALMSGYLSHSDQVQGLPLISKPFTRAALVTTIQDLFG